MTLINLMVGFVTVMVIFGIAFAMEWLYNFLVSWPFEE